MECTTPSLIDKCQLNVSQMKRSSLLDDLPAFIGKLRKSISSKLLKLLILTEVTFGLHEANEMKKN
jgi:hypothetical protein